MDEEQLKRGEAVVQRLKDRAKAASEATEPGTPHGSDIAGEQESLTEPGRPQGTPDPRTKSTGKGKKTADKWNQ